MTGGEKKQILKRKIEPPDIVRMAGIAVLLALLVWGGIFYTRTFLHAGGDAGGFLDNMLASAEVLKTFIATDRPVIGLAVMMFLQIMPVIVSAVPSSVTSFVGGMIYGVWGGMLVSIAGAAIGTAVSFYLARLLGRRVLTLFVSEKNIAKMEGLVDGETSALVLMALYALPTPKDFFAYFIGLTNMRASKLFLISAVGRVPGMLAATYLGANILERNYLPLVLCLVFIAAVGVLLVIFRSRIFALLNKKAQEVDI